MIKLERGECPAELTDELVAELTEIYKGDKEKEVWNSPMIKQPLKDALIKMSFGKCAYCECKLNIESKDVTIDHFKPKVSNENIVVNWDNLLPACLRCNRQKNRKVDEIINPCTIDPKEHLGVWSSNWYRLKEKTSIGKNTIRVTKLNDIDRLIVSRTMVCDRLVDRLNEIWEDINEEGTRTKFIDRFENMLCECKKETEYAAIKATKIINHETYKKVKEKLLQEEKWNERLEELEEELNSIKLQIL